MKFITTIGLALLAIGAYSYYVQKDVEQACPTWCGDNYLKCHQEWILIAAGAGLILLSLKGD